MLLTLRFRTEKHYAAFAALALRFRTEKHHAADAALTLRFRAKKHHAAVAALTPRFRTKNICWPKAFSGCHGIGKEYFVLAQSRFRTHLCRGMAIQKYNKYS
jgi:hypothetical protein